MHYSPGPPLLSLPLFYFGGDWLISLPATGLCREGTFFRMKLVSGHKKVLLALVQLGQADTEEIAYEAGLTKGYTLETLKYLHGKKFVAFCGKNGKKYRYNITQLGKEKLGCTDYLVDNSFCG